MRPIRFRFLLPVVFGCLAGALMVWELHNQRVIGAMGMAWDTGPPIWPYQTSWILRVSLNAPACLFASLLSALLGIQSVQAVLLFEFPMILAWWWFIGWRIDFGLLPKRTLRSNVARAAVFGLAAMVFIGVAVHSIVSVVRFWVDYSSFGWTGPLIFLGRNIGPLCWWLLLGIWSTAATIRLLSPLQSTNEKR